MTLLIRLPALALLGLLCSCGGASPSFGQSQSPGAGVPVAAEPGASPAKDVPGRAADHIGPRDRSLLERTHTGQEHPTVMVDNSYPAAQHVFVDWRWAGQVAPGTTATFDVPPGAHTITSADSPDPDDNPSSVTEAFETGYGYRYRIVAK